MSDARMVLTARGYPSFEEAQANPVTRVRDGDPLWLHLSFPTNLTDYGQVDTDAWDPTKKNCFLNLGIGPAGGTEVWREASLQYAYDDALGVRETAICLSQGLGGQNRSDDVFLQVVANGAPGVWENQVLLLRMNKETWTKDCLATCPITVDVAGGMTAYQRAARDYSMDVVRGNAATSSAPAEGRFVDRQVRDLMLEALDTRGYRAEHLYFTDDDWEVTGGQRPEFKQVCAAFLYRADGTPLRGNVIIARKYIALTDQWSDFVDPVIEDGFPLDEAAYAAAPGAIDHAAELARIRGGGEPARAGTAPASSTASAGGGDVVAQIRQLADLHAAGILTDEEFTTKKAELLGRL